MTEASVVTLSLDHVNIACTPDGRVIVRCYDAATETLCVWAMSRHVDGDGWYVMVSQVPIEAMPNADQSVMVH